MEKLVAFGCGLAGYLEREGGDRCGGVVVAGGSGRLRREATRGLGAGGLAALAVGDHDSASPTAGELLQAAAWLRLEVGSARIGLVTIGAAASASLALCRSNPELVAAVALLDPLGLESGELELVEGGLFTLQAHLPGTGPGPSPASIREQERLLLGRGVAAEFFVYPGASPGFLEPEVPGYDRLAARQTWERVSTLLLEELEEEGPDLR